MIENPDTPELCYICAEAIAPEGRQITARAPHDPKAKKLCGAILPIAQGARHTQVQLASEFGVGLNRST